LLRWPSRRGRHVADWTPPALPPVERDGMLVQHLGGGVMSHTPLNGPVQRGPAVDVIAPVPTKRDKHSRAHAPLFHAGGCRHDGTWTT
jgi:hypothetical protein